MASGLIHDIVFRPISLVILYNELTLFANMRNAHE